MADWINDHDMDDYPDELMLELVASDYVSDDYDSEEYSFDMDEDDDVIEITDQESSDSTSSVQDEPVPPFGNDQPGTCKSTALCPFVTHHFALFSQLNLSLMPLLLPLFPLIPLTFRLLPLLTALEGLWILLEKNLRPNVPVPKVSRSLALWRLLLVMKGPCVLFVMTIGLLLALIV